MADGADTGLWDKIKDFLPYAGAAAIGGVLGGPAGAVAGLGGAGETEIKQQDIQAQRQTKVAEMMMQAQQRKDELGLRKEAQQFRQQQAQWEQNFKTTQLTFLEQDRKSREAQTAWFEGQTVEQRAAHEADMVALRELGGSANRMIGAPAFGAWMKTQPKEVQDQAAALANDAPARTMFFQQTISGKTLNAPATRESFVNQIADATGFAPADIRPYADQLDGRRLRSVLDGTTSGQFKPTKPADILTFGKKDAASDTKTRDKLSADYASLKKAYFATNPFTRRLKYGTFGDYVTKNLKTADFEGLTDAQAATAKQRIGAYSNREDDPDPDFIGRHVFPPDGSSGGWLTGPKTAAAGGRVENVSAAPGASPDRPAGAKSIPPAPSPGATRRSVKGTPGWYDPKTRMFHPD